MRDTYTPSPDCPACTGTYVGHVHVCPLHAAAPALLAALRQAADTLDNVSHAMRHADTHLTHGSPLSTTERDFVETVTCNARAAIARAEGR